MNAPAKPIRVQLSRRKGWKMPENTVSVALPTRWGNPYRIGQTVHRGLSFSGRDEFIEDAGHAVRCFRQWLFTQKRSENLIPELRGKNLACWCSLEDKDGNRVPCHADVLLELANAAESGDA